MTTIGKQHNESIDKLTNEDYAKWVYNFPIPTQNEASDPDAMKMMGGQVEVQLTNILKDTTVKALKDSKGIELASDSNKSILGIIQYLEDQGVWMDMNTAIPILDKALDFQGMEWSGDKERHEAINFYLGLQMYDQYYQTGAIANMASATSEQDYLEDLSGFVDTTVAVSDSVDTQFSEIEDVSNIVPVGNDEFGTPIFQRRDIWDMDQINKANPDVSEQELLMQQHKDALESLNQIPDDTTNIGYNSTQTTNTAAEILGLNTEDYMEDLVLDSTGQTIDENVAERLGNREMIYDPEQGKLVPLSEYELGGGLTSLGSFLGGFVGDQEGQPPQEESPSLNDVVVNQALEEEQRNVLEPLSQGEMPQDSGFPMDLVGPESSYKTQNIMKQEGMFGKKDKHTYSEKLEKDQYFVKDFERFVPKDLLFLALQSLKENKMREGGKKAATDLRALQSQGKYYRGAQKNRPKNDQTGEIIEELFDESLYYFGQDFESVEAMLTALMSQ